MTTSRTDRRWFVVQAEVQREAKAAASLRALGYRVYEPMMLKTIIHHRTKLPITRRFRLLNRYMFVSLPHDAEWHIGIVRSCRGVDDILGVEMDGKAGEINKDVVRRFMLAQRRGEFDNINIALTRKQMARRLPIGTRIRVRHGHALGGFYGLVRKIKGRGVVQVGLELMGRLVSVDMPVRDMVSA